MGADDFIQFTGALEAVITVLDRSGAVALSETQIREAGALWGGIAALRGVRADGAGMSRTATFA